MAGKSEMFGDKALQRLRRKRFPRMVERQNVDRRRSWRRVGEFLTVGKNPLELDIRVEVLEQDLRRAGRRERDRRMRDE